MGFASKAGDWAFKAFTAGLGITTIYLTATFSVNVYRGLAWHKAQSAQEKEKRLHAQEKMKRKVKFENENIQKEMVENEAIRAGEINLSSGHVFKADDMAGKKPLGVNDSSSTMLAAEFTSKKLPQPEDDNERLS